MKIIYAVLLSLLSFTAMGQGNNSLMNDLKAVLAKTSTYDKQKEAGITTIKNQLKLCPQNNLARQYLLCSQLFDEYKSYQYDSAYVYTQKLINISLAMHDVPKQYESKIRLGIILISSGMFKETFDCLNQVHPKLLNKESKLRYYQLKSWFYSALAHYNDDKYHSKQYYEESTKYLDTAISLAEPYSFEQIMYKAELPDTPGQKKMKSHEYYELLLYHRRLTPHQTAMIATGISDYYHGDQRIRLLLIAAINDIKSSTKETQAVFRLGKELYEQGDVKNAYIFMQEALSNAEFFGSRLHKIEISSVLPVIAAKKIFIAENERNRFIIYLVSIVVIAIIISLVCFIVFIQFKRLRVKERIIAEKNILLEKTNLRLSDDAHIKEEYIGYFFNVISEYIVKLEKLKRNTERKIKSKKFEDISILMSDVNIKQERDDLFHTFDRVFLKIFPNFITAFNALLKPEDQIWPKGNEVLNTHLRIFALMRLGITDNETIAKILEYTVSTIYTYKIRIKTKSLVQGDEFDSRIMEIKVVDPLTKP